MITKVNHLRIIILSTFIMLMLNSFALAQYNTASGSEIITIYSEILKEDREIIVLLPDDYYTSTKRYPILFILDAEGETRFNLSVAAYTYYTGIRHLPKMIIVGIPNTNRTRDISPYKIEQRKSSGGGEAFLNFINAELIPYIDNNYRSNNFGILFGGSSAGTFVIYALYSGSDSINACIANRPALNSTSEITWDSEIIFERMNEFLKTQNCYNKSLYIDYGSREDEYHDPKPIHRLADLIMKKSPESFRFKIQETEESGYRSAESLANGLLWIFNSWYYSADSLFINGFRGIKSHVNNLSDIFNFQIIVADLLSESELNMFGNRFLERNNIDEAIRLFRYALEIYSESSDTYNGLGEALMKAGRNKEAIEVYEKSLQLEPSNENAKEQLKLLKSDD
ncbi:MAG: hypothetical protein A2V66_15975 [Ignavibacteria bacterium RBG_13_36_8]|nr:MAG: hypothetical protein A2V66_15975 [Ignavibacteria bacterium RBG_13_36_8]